MKLPIVLIMAVAMLSACNFKEDLKSAGDNAQGRVQNLGAEAKKVPSAVSEASNKIEKDIKE